MSDWQTIDTAPIDVGVDLWCSTRFGEYREPDCCWYDGAWCHQSATEEIGLIPIEDADTIVTHWMPRPKPPIRNPEIVVDGAWLKYFHDGELVYGSQSGNWADDMQAAFRAGWKAR